MSEILFLQLSLVIIMGVVISGILSLLKQPSIIGYILTGILIGPAVFNLVPSTASHATLATLGVSLLLFMVGLHLDPRAIKDVGKVSLIAGTFQVIITAALAFVLTLALNMSVIPAIYIAIGVTFSSTIIIMKLISDKAELDSLYGRITIGLLIFQDIIAMIALLLVSSSSGGSDWALSFGQAMLQAAGLIIIFFFVGKYFLPRLMNYIAKSQEYLLFFSIGWCLAIASLFYLFNLSIEVGALIAGITLAMSPFKQEISSKMKILRDFFVFLFFVVLGEQMVFGSVMHYIVPIIAVSLFIIIIKPIIVMTILGLLGYRKRTSFLVGISIGQVSAFSLILVGAGVAAGHINSEVLSFITLVGVITIASSSYLSMHSNAVYNFFSPVLNIFEKKANTKFEHEDTHKKSKYDVLIFGSDRTGYDIIESFQKKKMNFLVVDYNPDVITELRGKGIKCIYGDADDSELLAELQIEKAKLFVVTIPEADTNLLLLKSILLRNPKAIVICTAQRIEEAIELYELGAAYVIMPHFISGRHTSLMIHEFEFNIRKFANEKKKHLKHLKKRQKK